MRPCQWLSVLAIFFSTSVAFSQFAAERPTTPTPFGGGQLTPTPAPTRPAGTVPSLPGGVQPAGMTTPTATPRMPDYARREPLQPFPTTISAQPLPPHPWAVKAEHGEWMISVKSFGGPESRVLAEKLAKIIRDEHKVASYLFERNAAERAAELAKIDAIRQAEIARNAPLLAAMEQAKKEAEARGDVYIETTPKLKIPKPVMEAPEQWAVLIGGFPTSEAARKALTVVRELKAPTDLTLLDRTSIGGEETNQSGKTEFKMSWNYINPYKMAMVVPNPAAAKASLEEKYKLEPFIVKINADVPNSLLKVKKPWTLIVRNFSSPMKMAGKDGGDGNVFDKIKNLGTKTFLDVTAEEAERLADALRHPDMKPHPFEAYVLHHRTGSIVTVGGFDAPNDPELLRTREVLLGMTFKMMKSKTESVTGKDGRPDEQRLFDSVSPFPVPKY